MLIFLSITLLALAYLATKLQSLTATPTRSSYYVERVGQYNAHTAATAAYAFDHSDKRGN